MKRRDQLAIGLIFAALVGCGTPVASRPTPKPIVNLTAAPTIDLDATREAYKNQLQPTAQPLGLYIVRDGDTLESIALAFNTSVEEISATNKLENINLLSIGQPLIIPSLISGTSNLTITMPLDQSKDLTPTP